MNTQQRTLVFCIIICLVSTSVLANHIFDWEFDGDWAWVPVPGNYIWEGGYIAASIEDLQTGGSEDGDAVCFDWGDEVHSGYDSCAYDDNNGQECTGQTIYDEGCGQECLSGLTLSTDVEATDGVDSEPGTANGFAYFKCAEAGISTLTHGELYLVFDERRNDCQSTGSEYYDNEAKYAGTANDWLSLETVSCIQQHTSAWGCAPWAEDSSTEPQSPLLDDPCRKNNGTTSGYNCTVSTDCVSQVCGGNKINYRYVCDSDGQLAITEQQQQYGNSCGGQGYISVDWGGLFAFNCSETGLGGAGYVCDTDHDEMNVTDPSTPPSPCRKNISQSCSQDTDCWNDDGGNWCNSQSKCTDGANGRSCGNDDDCIADCVSGFCGDSTEELCNGKFKIYIDNSLDSSQSGYYVNINSVFNATTDAGGKEISSYDSCGESNSISVFCKNNQTKLCDSKTASIDFNGDNDSLTFNCNVCNNHKNLEISLEGIDYKETSGNTYQFNITINNENAAGTFNVMIKAQDKTSGLTTTEKIDQETITNSSGLTYNAIISDFDASNADYLHIYVDVNNSIAETNEADNYVTVPFVKKKEQAYLDINTGNSKVDDAIRGYLRLFVQEVNESSADLIIAVGKQSSKVQSFNDHTKNVLKWYIEDNVPYFNKIPIKGVGYTGLVGKFSYEFKPYVFAYGKNIEGDIAAVKKMISGKNIFLTASTFSEATAQYTAVVDEQDIIGLSVMDIMHNADNRDYFNDENGQDGERFKDIVENILLDNNYEISIMTVKTTSGTSYGQNTTLRVKHINSDFSTNFRDAMTNDSQPIVFSGGLFNDLIYWEENSETFISNLINDGRDLWEIEITGGPTQDCSTCPNYNYNDSRDYYWPALIAGVQQYSGQDSLQYVGHSNGCGVALASINQYQASGKNNAGYYFDPSTGTYQFMDLSSNAIDTFVGVGCPGALNGYSFFYDYFGRFGNGVASQISNNHVTSDQIGKRLEAFCKEELSGNDLDICVQTAEDLASSDDNPISRNLMLHYLNDIHNNQNLPQVNSGLSIRKFRLYSNSEFDFFIKRHFAGVFGLNATQHLQDVVVSQQDSQEISDRINASNNVKLINYSDFYHGRVDFDDFVENAGVFLNE